MPPLTSAEEHDFLVGPARIGNLDYLEARLKFPLSVIQLTPVRMNSWRVTSFPPDRTFTTEARWNPA